MERGSDKHGPRVDQELKHETAGLVASAQQTHTEEWREAEPAGEDQPEVRLVTEGVLPGGTPPGMSPADVEGRSELARYLTRSSLPAVRELLIQEAMDAGAPTALVDLLRGLPSGPEYRTVAAVWAALGGHNEAGRP